MNFETQFNFWKLYDLKIYPFVRGHKHNFSNMIENTFWETWLGITCNEFEGDLWDLKRVRLRYLAHNNKYCMCINDSGHTSPKSQVSQNLPDESFLEFVSMYFSYFESAIKGWPLEDIQSWQMKAQRYIIELPNLGL